MEQVTARILYPEIRAIDPEGGLYVWVDPDEYSTLMIQSLIKDAPFKTENSTEYHATVLYHKGPLHADIQMPMDFPARGRITEFVVWGEGTVVALVESPDLQYIHKSLIRQGLTHGHPEYSPHVTVGWDVKEDSAFRLWFDKVNTALKTGGLPIGFDPKIKGSSLA